MANAILKNGIVILRCANWAMEEFFNNFSFVVEQEGLVHHKPIADFLEQLDQDMQGRGLVMIDIDRYFNHSQDKLPLTLLYDLVLKTINRIKHKDYGEFQEGYFSRLDEFLNKILD